MNNYGYYTKPSISFPDEYVAIYFDYINGIRMDWFFSEKLFKALG